MNVAAAALEEVKQFYEGHLIPDPESHVAMGDVMDAYKEWCREKRRRPVSHMQFCSFMAIASRCSRGLAQDRHTGKTRMCWFGMRLKK